jgi:zinc transport system permease protein
MPTDLIPAFFRAAADATGASYSDLVGYAAILLVALIAGLVSPLVVGGRMAFFSDAMAHTGFAGAALGVMLLVAVAAPARGTHVDDSPVFWLVPVTMAVFATAFGVAIGYFRETTGLSADTVIGVFFALAAGFAAMLVPALNARTKFDPENMLFGSPMFTRPADFVALLALLAVTVAFLGARFNALVFAGFNPSLARSRGVWVSVNNYLFIVLLALIVNFTIRAVGMLVINAMLVVPAAAAANLSRSVGRLMLWSVAGSVGCGLAGYRVSATTQLTLFGDAIDLRPGGTIALLLVGWFLFTAFAARILGRRVSAVAGCDC